MKNVFNSYFIMIIQDEYLNFKSILSVDSWGQTNHFFNNFSNSWRWKIYGLLRFHRNFWISVISRKQIYQIKWFSSTWWIVLEHSLFSSFWLWQFVNTPEIQYFFYKYVNILEYKSIFHIFPKMRRFWVIQCRKKIEEIRKIWLLSLWSIQFKNIEHIQVLNSCFHVKYINITNNSRICNDKGGRGVFNHK